jgi:hypothetical protein
MHSETSCQPSFKAAVNILQSELKLKYLNNFSNIIEFHENPSSGSFESLHLYRITNEQKDRGFIQKPSGFIKPPRTITHDLVESHTAL